MATASERHTELECRGLLRREPDIRIAGGFTVVGGSGLGLPVSSVCSVQTLPNVVYMRVERDGEPSSVSLPYEELTNIDLGGGAQTTGRTYFGGGFGFQGAVEGMLIASALSRASQKTTINTGMHIAGVNGELLLHHGQYEPQAIRKMLSPLWVRWEAAKRKATPPAHASRSDDPLALLERLGELREAGVLTDEEFAAKKADLLSRM